MKPSGQLGGGPNPCSLDPIYLLKTLYRALCRGAVGNFDEIERRKQFVRLSWMNRHERHSEFTGNLAYCVGAGRVTASTWGTWFTARMQFERSVEVKLNFDAQTRLPSCGRRVSVGLPLAPSARLYRRGRCGDVRFCTLLGA